MSVAIKGTTKKRFQEANHGRDYSVYAWRMDAALESKARSLLPYFGDIQENDVIVDAGSGTGALAELIAFTFREVRPRVFGLDLSHELHERAQAEQRLTKLVFGDASRKQFPDHSVAVKYFSTSLHEIFSFCGRYRALKRTLDSTLHELIPGGRIIIRDFAKAPHGPRVYMKLRENVKSTVKQAKQSSGYIDYNTLSVSALLHRFQKEFSGGNAFTFSKTLIRGEVYYVIEPEWAHEFYLRKDYTGNWRQEIKEQYTYWTLHEARIALEQAGFVNVKVIPDPNEYILTNRLRGKVALYWRVGNELREVDFPPTHMIVYGEKPRSSRRTTQQTSVDQLLTNYEKLVDSCEVDQVAKVIMVGKKRFAWDGSPPLIGDKKFVYRLAGNRTRRRVLKVARRDAYNLHNVFKSMYQVIERQWVLKEYRVPHMSVLDFDREGPPYRFVIQEALPPDAVCAADLIKSGELGEIDIRQIAEIVNAFERKREWQLDMNPFGWFRTSERAARVSRMVYVTGKVYRYDEMWGFLSVGLLQWIDPVFVQNAHKFTAEIPNHRFQQSFLKEWERGDSDRLQVWKRYLRVFPVLR